MNGHTVGGQAEPEVLPHEVAVFHQQVDQLATALKAPGMVGFALVALGHGAGNAQATISYRRLPQVSTYELLGAVDVLKKALMDNIGNVNEPQKETTTDGDQERA